MELTFCHKYIKNTSTSGTIHTEHLLNAGRTQTSERASKPPQVNRWDERKKKNKKRERNHDGTCAPGREL